MYLLFRRGLVFFLAIFSIHSLAQTKKSSKSKSVPPAPVSLIQQAQKAIAVDPKSQVSHSASPQNTGILVMKAPDLNDKRNPTRFPFGIHFDSYSFSGTATSSNNVSYQYSEMSSVLLPSLELGMIPYQPFLFDAYSLQLGYQRKEFLPESTDSLSQAHYVVKLMGENKFFVRGKWDARYAAELGLVQTQITDSSNSLANVTRKSTFVGLGLQGHYHFYESLSTDVGISYRYALANRSEYQVDPLGLGAGISFIW